MKLYEILTENALEKQPSVIMYNPKTDMYLIVWRNAFAIINSTGTSNKISGNLLQLKSINTKGMTKINSMFSLPSSVLQVVDNYIRTYIPNKTTVHNINK